MANHLTPTQLAHETGLDRSDVIMKCLEMGVPIYNGRIDRTLFAATLQAHDRRLAARLPLATG